MSGAAPTTSSLAKRILARAARPGGVSRHEVLSHLIDRKDRPSTARLFDALVKSGELMLYTRPAKGGGTGQPSRQYFANAEDGERWRDEVVRAPKQAPAPKLNFATLVKPSNRSKSATLEADAPVVVPKGVKVQVGPSHPFDARYQLDPATRITGGFQSLGPGRYLESGE
jgi:hypothetical protein